MKIFKSSFFKFILVSVLFICFLIILIKNYSDHVFGSISNNFFRLHIVANSDSTEDQVIKYEIRDSILNYISPELKNSKSKDEALRIIQSNIPAFYDLSNNILSKHNVNYSVNISVGNYNFPTKDYSNFVLPEGNYDALKIELGNASGQNWWCVMFPSICIIDNSTFSTQDSTNDILENSLDSEELSIISKDTDSPDIKIKFKLIELFENL